MEIEIKEMGSANQKEMFDLAAYAFNSEETDERRTRFNFIVDHSLNHGYFIDGRLTNQIISTNFKVNFHGTIYQLSGIGAVSSYPENRGEGGISALMKVLLKKLSNQQIELAYLAPFSYPFYRQYGFEQLFEQISYRVKAENWPKIKKVEGSVQRVDWGDAREVIASLYPKIKQNHQGALIREEWWLEYIYGMKKNYKFAIYRNSNGIPEGYLGYTSTFECFEINEFGYLNKSAFQALARFIGSHNGSSKEFSYKKGFDGTNLSFLIPSPLVEMTVTPYMMGRIVNIQNFLRKYPFKSGKVEHYYLEVNDSYGYWNEGRWLLSINGKGKGTIEKIKREAEVSSANLVIHGSIQKFTQLFMGYQTGAELHFFEEITGDEETILALSNRLPKGRPILEDYF